MSGPQFFVDRSLGRHRVPRLLRDDDWSLVTLAEHYGVPADEDVADVDWLQLAGSRGWAVLMKDEKIRQRPAEREAVILHGVRGFYLTSGNLTSRQMAESFVVNREAIWRLAGQSGAGLFAVSRDKIREIDLAS